MKVIDLLNKIANGETPNFIKVKDTTYIFDEYISIEKMYHIPGNRNGWLETDNIKLNDEVEIIEEDKEIEDTKYMRHHEGDGKCYIESKGHKYYVPYDLLLLIDDLVKAVNELKKGK